MQAGGDVDERHRRQAAQRERLRPVSRPWLGLTRFAAQAHACEPTGGDRSMLLSASRSWLAHSWVWGGCMRGAPACWQARGLKGSQNLAAVCARK
jgi:hypothetical protein